ncbi:MAG: NADPH:quinone reductase [Armatimonadota bacterium]
MEAIRVHQFGEPEVMRLEGVPDPTPGAGQVLVKLHAIGVNPVEAYIRAGRYGPVPFPYTPGTDAAGVVEAIGDGVRGITVGDRVYTAGTVTGAYASKAVCEAAQIHPLPTGVGFSQGAALGVPYGTAYRALFQRAHAKAGEVVMIHGASGGVGIATVQFARAAGMTVIATAGSERGRRLVSEQGAHHVLDHGAADHLEKALALTEGAGVDVIVEFRADINLGGDLTILARGGRVAVVGSRGRVEVDPRDTMGREAAILGVMLMGASETERAAIHAAIGAGLQNGTLRPVIGEEIPLAEAARAHHAMMEQPAYGKRVLIA